ncbi:MAG TPA: ArsR family transcriptional regulator [Candidatus Nanoarchaeia archaeon]|nr:ArsR family transcriptional regulator [Candidatus Nanoarchaeia archaeon]
MELELMFSEQKWNILKCLSNGKYSPIQLAQMLNTTMANISQQLRLLEATNLVKKEKIKNRDKGKPRTLFSLNEDCAYIIPTMSNFAEKKLLKVEDHHRIILKIWFLVNPELHSPLEKIYFRIEPHLKKINFIGLMESSRKLVIASDDPGQIEKTLGKVSGFEAVVLSTENAKKLAKSLKSPFSSIESMSVIFNRDNIISQGGGN